jgi:hypothetical protein
MLINFTSFQLLLPKVLKEDSFLVSSKPAATTLKCKATVHFGEEEEGGTKGLGKPEKDQKCAAPEKDTSVNFGPVRTVISKIV